LLNKLNGGYDYWKLSSSDRPSRASLLSHNILHILYSALSGRRCWILHFRNLIIYIYIWNPEGWEMLSDQQYKIDHGGIYLIDTKSLKTHGQTMGAFLCGAMVAKS
jgi:hypothetical protein